MDAQEDGTRSPRTLHCQFLRAATVGGVEVEVVERKSGRRVDFYGATLEQGGEVCVYAASVFAAAQDGAVDYCDLEMPVVEAARGVARAPRLSSDPPIFERLDMRPAIDRRGSCGAPQSLGGGWISCRDPRANDVLSLCLFLDAWTPSPTARLGRMPIAPTLEYWVMFRDPRPERHEGPVLLKVVSGCASEGYFEEDSFIWSATGMLLAQGRQLAILS